MATYEQMMSKAAEGRMAVEDIPKVPAFTVTQVTQAHGKYRPRYEGQLDPAGSVFVRVYVPVGGKVPNSITVSDEDLRPLGPRSGAWVVSNKAKEFAGTCQREYDDKELGVTVILNTDPAADIDGVSITF
jgi:hypothetical protein